MPAASTSLALGCGICCGGGLQGREGRSVGVGASGRGVPEGAIERDAAERLPDGEMDQQSGKQGDGRGWGVPKREGAGGPPCAYCL
jgi:hypothetical protein